MNILTISFTNHTSRYLSFIEEQIAEQKDRKIDLKIHRLSVYPSSHYYYKSIGKKDQILYRFNGSDGLNSVPDIPELRNYHTSVLSVFGKKKYTQRLLNEYNHIFSEIQHIMDKGITHCILIGDSRMPVEIAAYIAKLNHIKCLYIEQAPYGNMIFWGTPPLDFP